MSLRYPPPPPDRLPSPTPHSLRFPSSSTSSSFNLTNLTVHIPQTSRPPSSTRQTRPEDPPPPSRWRTKEFYLYYALFLVVVPIMGSLGARVSRESNPLYWQYQHRLSKGWLFGWKIDLTDPQYSLFRTHLPLLLFLALSHILLSRLFRALFSPSPSALARARFSAAFSVVLVVALHGTSALKIAGIMVGNWAVVKVGIGAAGRGGRGGDRGKWYAWRESYTPFAVWGFNLAVLFGNELNSGWKFKQVSESLAFLDAYPGILPRWHISWNISMLRLVSWGMECYWSSVSLSSSFSDLPPPLTSPLQKAVPSSTSSSPSPSTAPTRAPDTLDLEAFTSPALYISYVLYPPLYLAGPIMSFPSYVSQLRLSSSSSSSSSPSSPSPPPPPMTPLSADEPPPSATAPGYNELSLPALVSYALRFLFSLLTMEVLLHCMYPVAIKDAKGLKDGEGWYSGLGAAEVAIVGFWNLVVVWLKLLLPWRFFRLWALLDGLNPPENMVRCMANNYSTLGFWRSWHRSYNLWVIRYLYIPLGGSSRPLLATLGVFTFVALWHDLQLRLLLWGWAVTAFVIPEMVGRKVVPGSRYGSKPWYRHLAALGAVFNILLMMTANLVGFVVGIDGARELWGKMVGGDEGRLFLLTACTCLFVAVQVMFEYREEERRKGINRKC